jgi:hypothetical protein
VAVVTFPGVAVVGDIGSRSGDGVQRQVAVVLHGGCMMQAAAGAVVTLVGALVGEDGAAMVVMAGNLRQRW